MMTARAKIEWLEENKIPPVLLEKERVRANSYSPTIVFKGQYNKPVWDGNICSVSIWSSVIFNESIEGNGNPQKLAEGKSLTRDEEETLLDEKIQNHRSEFQRFSTFD